MEKGETDRLKQLQKNWLIILALGKGLEAEEPLKDKVGIEEDFLFNFLKRDQKSLEDEEEDSLLNKRESQGRDERIRLAVLKSSLL